VPVYEYVCQDCGERVDRILPHSRAGAPGHCPACGADRLDRRFSRVAVKLEGWGFSKNDAMVPDRPGGRNDWKQVKDKAERLSDTGSLD